MKKSFIASSDHDLVAYMNSIVPPSHLEDLDSWVSELVEKTGKKIVLMIDEVDKSSNNQLFLDFLGMLRNKYLKRDEPGQPTFHSVILAGVHDVKSLKIKYRKGSEAKFNSPWNIAVDFEVNLSFSATAMKIATKAPRHQGTPRGFIIKIPGNPDPVENKKENPGVVDKCGSVHYYYCMRKKIRNGLSMAALLLSLFIFTPGLYGQTGFTQQDRETLVELKVTMREMDKRISDLREDMNKRFEQVDKRFEQVDKRFEQVDKRFEQMMSFVWVLATIFGGMFTITIGFALWDRRTMIALFKQR